MNEHPKLGRPGRQEESEKLERDTYYQNKIYEIIQKSKYFKCIFNMYDILYINI